MGRWLGSGLGRLQWWGLVVGLALQRANFGWGSIWATATPKPQASFGLRVGRGGVYGAWRGWLDGLIRGKGDLHLVER